MAGLVHRAVDAHRGWDVAVLAAAALAVRLNSNTSHVWWRRDAHRWSAIALGVLAGIDLLTDARLGAVMGWLLRGDVMFGAISAVAAQA